MTEQVRARIPTDYGDFFLIAYANDEEEYSPDLVLITEELDTSQAVNVRIHSECITGDLIGSRRCDCGQQLDLSLSYIAENSGILVYLRQEGRGIGLIPKLKAYNLQDEGMNTLDANLHLGFDADERTYEHALKILNDLDVKEINLLTNNPDKLKAFDESHIKINKRIPLEVKPNEENESYLETKKDFMGHLLRHMK